MRLIVFSKAFKEKSVDALVALALRYGFEGYDLCVRPGYPVNPDNVGEKLPEVAQEMARNGLGIPMVTGNFDLLTPDHPTAEPILAAMERSDVRLLKLGYFRFDPARQDYWQEVNKVRTALEGWQTLARRHRVKVCYHTHSHQCMGLNAAALAHLVQDFDPQAIGAYLDPGHMVVEGEEFGVGVAMVQRYLSIVGLKDMLKWRVDADGHGRAASAVRPAGQGMVDWTAVFAELRRIGYAGPLSVHCEYEAQGAPEFLDLLGREIQFFKQMRDKG